MVLLQRGLQIKNKKRQKKKKNEYLFFNLKSIYMKHENIIIDFKKKIEIKKITK
jgi:hypothetical protein